MSKTAYPAPSGATPRGGAQRFSAARLLVSVRSNSADAPASGVEREAERAEFQRRMARKQTNNRRNANKNRKRDRMPI